MDYTAIIIAVIGSTAFSTIIQAIIKAVEKKKSTKDSYASGIRLVLYSQLKNDAKAFCEDGEISKTEYDAFMEGYATYKALGGDGYMQKIKERVESLPIILD